MECTTTALVAAAVLTALVILPQVLKLVDLWVSKGVSIAVLGQLTMLIIPQFLVASLPMALLIGILLSLGRLSQDSEVIIMRASGISLYQIASPIAILVLLFASVSLWLNWYWVPHSHQMFFRLKSALVSANTLDIKTQMFNHAIPGLTIYVNDQTRSSNLMKGLMIHDRRDSDEPVTLIAQSGQLHTTPDGDTALYLKNGSRHSRSADGRFRQLDFSTFDLELGLNLELKPSKRKQKIKEFHMNQLERETLNKDPKRANEAKMEWHRRLAIPAATVILGLLAIPLGIQSHRTNRSYGFVIAILILVVHFMMLTTGEALAKKSIISPEVGLWTPNIIMTLLLLSVMHNTAREKESRLMMILSAIGSVPHSLYKRLSQRQEKR
ncbi:MAG: LPS export ABC transporter permease LptF [Magnetococcales bacterium]|nr:LPS export ABC transporter permease LptF [Magnetococcales bacterium]